MEKPRIHLLHKGDSNEFCSLLKHHSVWNKEEIRLNLLYLASILKSRRKLFNVISNMKCLRDISPLNIVLGSNRKILYDHYISNQDLEILRLLLSECRLSLNKRLLTQLLDKKPMTVKLNDASFYIECVEDLYHSSLCYETEMLEFIEHNVDRDSVFVDVGANIGGFAVRFAKNCRVYAFEPDLRNYSLLCLNLALNNLRAYTYNNAVSNISGKVRLHVSEYHGRHSIECRSTSKYCEVEAVRLDDVLVEEDTVDVLKIDVEGAELKVLQGALDTLPKTKLLLVECATRQKRELVHRLLTHNGFKHLQRFRLNHVYLRI